ncbi:low-complexity tail membrane protein [Leptolyngbya sp. FACHB-261]|nr:low-complexity tail membrane protein [Leptolyngbya sp. FACHB-261]
MPPFWDEPFLWIHLAGLAAVPLALWVCTLGLAVGNPALPVELELLLVAAIGIGPILWMQWYKPFDIFSIIAVCLQPTVLTDNQRRVLRLFKTPLTRVVTVVGAVLMVLLLRRLYDLSPLLADIAPLPASWRLLGLLLAGAGFLAANLFLQVPLSVLRVLTVSQLSFESLEPYPTEQVDVDFTLLGWQVQQILPKSEPLMAETPVVTPPVVTGSSVTELPAIDPSATEPASAGAVVASTLAEAADDVWADSELLEETTESRTDEIPTATIEDPPATDSPENAG